MAIEILYTRKFQVAQEYLAQLAAHFLKQLALHEKKHHITGQVNSLVNVAHIVAFIGYKAEGLAYLDRAEQMLSNLKPDDLTQIANERGSENLPLAHQFVSSRLNQINNSRIAIKKRRKGWDFRKEIIG